VLRFTKLLTSISLAQAKPDKRQRFTACAFSLWNEQGHGALCAVVEKTKSATQVAFACTLDARVTWSAMKCAFADIRNRYTELTAARARDQTQTPKKLSPFGASAKHSKRKKLLTLASPN
jgi:hypothetical protein